MENIYYYSCSNEKGELIFKEKDENKAELLNKYTLGIIFNNEFINIDYINENKEKYENNISKVIYVEINNIGIKNNNFKCNKKNKIIEIFIKYTNGLMQKDIIKFDISYETKSCFEMCDNNSCNKIYNLIISQIKYDQEIETEIYNKSKTNKNIIDLLNMMMEITKSKQFTENIKDIIINYDINYRNINSSIFNINPYIKNLLNIKDEDL